MCSADRPSPEGRTHSSLAPDKYEGGKTRPASEAGQALYDLLQLRCRRAQCSIELRLNLTIKESSEEGVSIEMDSELELLRVVQIGRSGEGVAAWADELPSFLSSLDPAPTCTNCHGTSSPAHAVVLGPNQGPIPD